MFSWIIGHSGEDGRYVNSPEKSGGSAFKDKQVVRVYIELVEWRFAYISLRVTLRMCGSDGGIPYTAHGAQITPLLIF